MDSKESEGPNPSVKQGPLVIMENVKFPTYGGASSVNELTVV